MVAQVIDIPNLQQEAATIETAYRDACRDWRKVNDRYLGAMRAVTKAQRHFEDAVTHLDAVGGEMAAAHDRRAETFAAYQALHQRIANVGEHQEPTPNAGNVSRFRLGRG